MEHFTGEFNNHKTDVMKNGPFKDAKKAKNFCEERAQNVIHGLAQQNLQAQQHTNLLSQAA
jgi:hypothetical protein